MITIFGTPTCGYCREAKALCERKELSYKYVDITVENIDFSDFEALTGKKFKTVPQIFNGEQYVGGYKELKELLDK
jgi:glutaredoxin 1